jgi:EndoU nuclease-like protein
LSIVKRFLIALAGIALAVLVYLNEPRKEAPARPPAAVEAPRAAAPGSSREETRWSDTRPAVNQAHIFEGEINRRGKPVGFHSRPGGEDPPDARVVRIVDGPNRAGVYVADVEIRNRAGHWLEKRSTFYPDRLSREEVLAAILHAWNEREEESGNLFRGPSGEGFTIEGRTTDDGAINTAYPLFDEGQ